MLIYFIKPEDFRDTRLHFLTASRVEDAEVFGAERFRAWISFFFFYSCLFYTLHIRIIHFNTPQGNEGKTLVFPTKSGLY